jgi:hypothetical protein
MSDIQSYLAKAAIGGGSCAIAGAILNPIDVVKIRMQNNSVAYPWPEKNTVKGLMRIVRTEGVAGLTRGLNATIMREMVIIIIIKQDMSSVFFILLFCANCWCVLYNRYTLQFEWEHMNQFCLFLVGAEVVRMMTTSGSPLHQPLNS